MTTINEIRYSQLENRFDSEYYHPLKLNYLRELGKLPQVEEISNNFISIRDIFDPDSFQEKEKLAKVVRLEDIANFSLSKFQVCKAWKVGSLKKKFKTGDILISRLRSYLKEITFVTNFNEGINLCSTEFIVLRPKQYGKILPTYLFAFLLTKQAQTILQWSQEGSNHPRFPERVLLSIKIPLPPKSFQLHIEELVKEAFAKRKLADQKYEQAKQLLEKELGLDKLELKEEKSFEAKFSEVEKSRSFSSEYYKPKFTENLNLIKSLPHKKMKLEDIIRTIKYGTSEKLDYTDKGTPFLRVTDIDSFNNININEVRRIPNYELPKVKNAIVKKDDILISRTGTLGVAVYINDELDNSVFGSYFIKMEVDKKEVNPFYLTIFLNSKMGRLQSEKSKTGAIQTNLTIPIIKSLKIVVPRLEIQEIICKEYLESFILRKESKELLNKAKQEIEELIENGTRK